MLWRHKLKSKFVCMPQARVSATALLDPPMSSWAPFADAGTEVCRGQCLLQGHTAWGWQSGRSSRESNSSKPAATPLSGISSPTCVLPGSQLRPCGDSEGGQGERHEPGACVWTKSWLHCLLTMGPRSRHLSESVSSSVEWGCVKGEEREGGLRAALSSTWKLPSPGHEHKVS